MDLRQLKYFLVVAEEGQITKAAKRLFITQPPLSQQLIALEKELGIQLFERTGREMRLTDAGRTLKEQAERIFELVDRTIVQLQETSGGISGHLSIGTITTSGNSHLSARLQKFHRAYPKISFYIRQAETDKILEMLDSGLIDVGIVRFPVNCDRYDFISFPEESMALAMMAAGVGRDLGAAEAKRLLAKPLLVHHRHQSMVVEYCHRLGLEPDFLCISDDIIPLLLLANSGIGVAVLPESAKNVFPGAALTYRTLSDPAFTTTSALVWPKKRPPRPAASRFIAFFQ